MKYIPPKFDNLSDMAAIDAGRLTEREARTILEAIRWPNEPVCPHCGGIAVTWIQAKSVEVREGIIQCNGCRGQFTVTVGTIMERSCVALRQWRQAFHSICSHKKDVSALQLQQDTGLRIYEAIKGAEHERLIHRESANAS